MQRLQILWHTAYYGIPGSRVKEHFLIAKSTLYRWLHVSLSGTREAGLTSRCQPEGGDPRVREEPPVDSTRESLG